MKNERVERHHVEPLYRHPKNTSIVEVTLPEHAYLHWLEATDACRPVDAKANFWAVSAIVRRMQPDELTEFNQMISRRPDTSKP